jgi:hypothetical protein
MGYSGRLNLCNGIFGIHPVDYRRASYGLLIGSGAGVMMGVMDIAPRFRFALDADQYRGRETYLCDWIRAMDRNCLVDLIAVCGWFSITDPIPLAGALDTLSAPTVVYSGGGLGREIFEQASFTDSLDEFLRRVEHALLPAPFDKGKRLRSAQDPAERSLEPSAARTGEAIDDAHDADHPAKLQRVLRFGR